MSDYRSDSELLALAQQATEDAKTAGGFTFWDLTDDGLARVRRQYLRMIEDNPGRPHAQLDAWLASIRWVRLVRWCLHMRYGAVDEHRGTKDWNRYYRHGDAPAYSLAIEIDRLRWTYRDHPRMTDVGPLRRHILDWARLGGQPHPLASLGQEPAA